MAEPPLDDVALRVLQLEPEDRQDLGCAREQLARLAVGNRVVSAAQPFVARAIEALEPLTDGTAADPVSAMREVGQLLQRAVEAAPSIAALAQSAGDLVQPARPAPAAVRGHERDVRETPDVCSEVVVLERFAEHPSVTGAG